MMNASPSTPPPADAVEHEICFSCLQENEAGTHFCRHCRTPLTAYSTTGPIERVYALGDFARKVVHHPKGWIRTLGWLLIFVISTALLFGMMLP